MTRTLIVPVSGGKDSQAVLSLALETGREVVCVHQDTGFDHPDTGEHLRAMERFYGVTVERTRSRYGGMFGFLEHAGYFPNNAARGCTQRLKQEPFARWLQAHGFDERNCEIWFGMRAEESAARAGKYGALAAQDTFRLGDVALWYGEGWRKPLGRIGCRLPIVDWTEAAVFGRLAAEGAPANPLYARGHRRVGCYPCFLARKSEWQAVAQDPTGVHHLQRLIELEERWRAEGNPRKFIRVHRVWDARAFLAGAVGALPEAEGECGYCSI